MPELKPWKSMNEQLSLLVERGLYIDDEKAALDYLSRIGYYRLSGYWYPLREIDREKSKPKHPVRKNPFAPDSQFKDIAELYVFDKKLRLLALDALERIEMAIRVDVAHLLGRKEPCAHENPDCLHGNFSKKLKKSGPDQGKTEHEVWLIKYKGMLHRARKEPFIQHHKANYSGQVPVWVAIEVWDFGLLSRMFEGMEHGDKNQIAEKYEIPNGIILAQWLRSLNFIRNVSAHHSRLWNINIVDASPPYQKWATIDQTRPFMYFVIMAYLLAVICPRSSWTARLISHLKSFPTSKNGILNLKGTGICENWEQVLTQVGK